MRHSAGGGGPPGSRQPQAWSLQPSSLERWASAFLRERWAPSWGRCRSPRAEPAVQSQPRPAAHAPPRATRGTEGAVTGRAASHTEHSHHVLGENEQGGPRGQERHPWGRSRAGGGRARRSPSRRGDLVSGAPRAGFPGTPLSPRNGLWELQIKGNATKTNVFSSCVISPQLFL